MLSVEGADGPGVEARLLEAADLRGRELVHVDQPSASALLVGGDGAHAVPRDLIALVRHSHHRHRAPRATQPRLARLVHVERAPQRRARRILRHALRHALRRALRRASLRPERGRERRALGLALRRASLLAPRPCSVTLPLATAPAGATRG
eukprot:scaffold44766_cov64-Phaeocystis_antarctica.AAC.9